MKVVGVDGYRAGWVAIALEEGRFSGASVHLEFEGLLAEHGDAAVVAVDIPIGMPKTGMRQADAGARRRLKGQASSVFNCPPRAVLECATHAEATALSLELVGRGVSQQSFALRHRILEVDALATDQVIEVHPEVSFVAMAEGRLPRKKSWAGAMRRRALLERFGIELPSELGPAGVAPVDDVLDAGAAAWSALRHALGQSASLPSPPEDIDGRQVAIWY